MIRILGYMIIDQVYMKFLSSHYGQFLEHIFSLMALWFACITFLTLKIQIPSSVAQSLKQVEVTHKFLMSMMVLIFNMSLVGVSGI